MALKGMKERLKRGLVLGLASAMCMSAAAQTGMTDMTVYAAEDTAGKTADSVQEEDDSQAAESTDAADAVAGSTASGSTVSGSTVSDSTAESSQAAADKKTEGETMAATAATSGVSQTDIPEEETALAASVSMATSSAAVSGTVIYQNDMSTLTGTDDNQVADLADGNQALCYNVTCDSSKGWQDLFDSGKGQGQFQLDTPYTGTMTSANLSYDIYLPDDANFSGSMKAQAVLRIGSGWTWVNQQTWPEYTIADFKEDSSTPGYKKITVSIAINKCQTWDGSKGANVDFAMKDLTPVVALNTPLAGCNCDYSGKVYLDNVVLTDTSAADKGDEQVSVDALSLSMDAGSWKPADADYAYDGANTSSNPDFRSESGAELLALNLDYSGNSEAGWSEAKYDYTHPSAVSSMKGYDTFTADVYYKPSDRTKGSFQMKIYNADMGLNAYEALPEGTEVTGVSGLEGYYRSSVTISFTQSAAAFSGLSFGMVGSGTDYTGTVYLANAQFSQEKKDDIYVDATVRARTDKAGITVSADGKSITTGTGEKVSIDTQNALADADATEGTRKLYAYLKAVGASDSVIFGHQNDTHHKAGAATDGFTESDTKDLTGSISGVVGIDALSLTGNEAVDSGATWDASLSDRVAAVEKITRKAADQGAVITLSAHMPNFDVIDKRVKAYEAGGKTASTSDTLGYTEDADGNRTYNFSGYTPNVLTGDVVSRIMPGQDLNYLYTAYLDMIAAYADAAENDGITILFRPFHECTGSWFWWGSAFCDSNAYISLYRYTEDYLRNVKGVHNILYVYGPGSEAESTADYAARYPGDDYVDMIGYDLYQQNPSTDNEADYLAAIEKENGIMREFAGAHDKLYAVTETGVANGSDALLTSGNQVKDWYTKLLGQLEKDQGCCYFLLWANFGTTSGFYVPYAVSRNADGTLHGHEMMDDFTSFYNDDHSVFASDMNHGSYHDLTDITNTTTQDSVSGYFTSPYSGSRILEKTTFKAAVNGISDPEDGNVKFVFAADDGSVEPVTIAADYQKASKDWEAELGGSQLALLGEKTGTASLLVNGSVKAQISLKFNMKEAEADPLSADDFENYYGVDSLLNSAWATNKDSGCSVTYSLTKDAAKVFNGSYALQFNATLKTKSGWAGATKTLNADWSSANALQFYTVPEGQNQKVVIQLTSGKNVFEVYLQDYAAYAGKTGAMKVTVPFSAFTGRDDASAVFDASTISSIGLWCNAVDTGAVTFPLSVSMCYDDIRAVKADSTEVTFTSVPGAAPTPTTPVSPATPSGTTASGAAANSTTASATTTGGSTASGTSVSADTETSAAETAAAVKAAVKKAAAAIKTAVSAAVPAVKGAARAKTKTSAAVKGGTKKAETAKTETAKAKADTAKTETVKAAGAKTAVSGAAASAQASAGKSSALSASAATSISDAQQALSATPQHSDADYGRVFLLLGLLAVITGGMIFGFMKFRKRNR